MSLFHSGMTTEDEYVECRSCGVTVDDADQACPSCGSDEIAVYDLQSRGKEISTAARRELIHPISVRSRGERVTGYGRRTPPWSAERYPASSSVTSSPFSSRRNPDSPPVFSKATISPSMTKPSP